MAEPIIISHQHRQIVLPWTPTIAALVPHARRVLWDGVQRLVVPHDLDHARLLHNVDIAVPSPILTDYDWCGAKPWDVQKETAALLSVSPRCYVFNQMRTGKTRAALWASDYLMRQKKIQKALVIAPLSTLNIVWGQEVYRALRGRRFVVLHGTKEKRLKRLAEDVDFYVINHDGVEVIKDELLTRRDINCVILDEAASYRNSRTQRWKALHEIVRETSVVWALTGKPTPNAPTDAYGIGKLVTPGRLPRYFGQFREQTMLKVSQFRWVPKKEANAVVHEALKPSVRFTRADIATSEPTIHLDRECALSPQAAAAMAALMSKLRVQLANGDITARNAGVLVNKLTQIATGWVYDDKGKVIDMSSPTRLQAIVDVLNETDRKVLVFVPYIHAVQNVAAKLIKEGFDTCVVHGGTPARQREEIFGAFQNTSRYDVMVAHPVCMSHGLLLTAADTVVWYGPPPSNETYSQANDRVALPGLNYQTAVIHIIGHAVEKRRYKGLRAQENVHEQLLDMLSGVQD